MSDFSRLMEMALAANAKKTSEALGAPEVPPPAPAPATPSPPAPPKK